MNLFSFRKSGVVKLKSEDAITAIARDAARSAAEEAISKSIGGMMEVAAANAELSRRNGGTVWANTAAAFAMNDPRRYRDYADPRVRPYTAINVDTLRTLARTYDILGACISHLKSEVIKTPIRIAARDDKADEGSFSSIIAEANTFFFDASGGLGGPGKTRDEFEGEMLDDLLVIGAAAVLFDYQTVGARRDCNPDRAIAIDASTIRPLITPSGFLPEDDEYAFEQVVQGRSVGQFLRAELVYSGLPIYAQTYSPYFVSPVEQLALVVMTALKSDEWNRTWLTDGNVPDMLIQAPKNWTPEQVRDYAKYFDDLLSGDSRARHKVRIVPEGVHGSQQTRKEADFQAFETWLRDRTCSVMRVNPASIGYSSEIYKSTEEGAMDSTAEGGVAQLLAWRRRFYNELLKMKGWGALHVVDEETDTENERSRAERHEIEIRSGQRTINEVRKDDGFEPFPEPGADTVFISSTVQPLANAIAAPEEAEPDSDEDKPSIPAKSDTKRVLRLWETKSLNRIGRGQSAQCTFVSETLSDDLIAFVFRELDNVNSRHGVREVFDRAANWKETKGMDGSKKLTEDDVAFTDEELAAMTDDLENDEEAVKVSLGLATPEKKALMTAKVIGQTGVVE